jgi:hypothetical protein
LEFNGTNQFFPIPNASSMVTGNFTVFVVERRKSARSNNFFLGGTTGARNNNLVLGYVLSNRMRFAFFANDVDGAVAPYSQSLEPTRVWAFEKTPLGRTIYVDGTRLSGDNNRETLQSWGGAALGRFGMGDFYGGTIYEVLIYNTSLPVDKRQKLEGYLANKWGTTGSLPAGHPFKINSP